MNWTELLEELIETTYKTAERLIGMVGDDELDWRPATGANWMSTGQLLQHVATACGHGCRGFVTGDWGLPEGIDFSDMSPDEMLPPAEQMPAAASVAEAQRALAEDKAMALAALSEAGEEALAGRVLSAPWDPRQRVLGFWFLQSVDHLAQHRGQLFYYLKLQGRPVDTQDLWGV